MCIYRIKRTSGWYTHVSDCGSPIPTQTSPAKWALFSMLANQTIESFVHLVFVFLILSERIPQIKHNFMHRNVSGYTIFVHCC